MYNINKYSKKYNAFVCVHKSDTIFRDQVP